LLSSRLRLTELQLEVEASWGVDVDVDVDVDVAPPATVIRGNLLKQPPDYLLLSTKVVL